MMNIKVANFKPLKPKNLKQKVYFDKLNKPTPVVIATGCSGTGKTTIATYVGIQKLMDGEIEKLIITRPTVSVGPDDLGFLPGNLNMKLEPWMRPVYDALNKSLPTSKIEKMMKDKVIELAPLGFLRGCTFSDSWVICDEAQNMTRSQMLMMVTRIGKNSKLVITGDPKQYDRGYDDNGLSDILYRLQGCVNTDFVDVVEFDENDVERHPAIPYFLHLYS